MTFKELKEIVNKLPDYLEDSEVLMTKIDEHGFRKSFPLDKVVFSNTEVLFWSNYHEEQDQ